MRSTMNRSFYCLLLLIIAAALVHQPVRGSWISPPASSSTISSRIRPSSSRGIILPAAKHASLLWQSASSSSNTNQNNNMASTSIHSFQPVLDFENDGTIDKIDRLDDAIMGGISTSSVLPGDSYARWGGICRTDGGGFCGFRTNPFEEPLLVVDSDGIYVKCRLASDDEPERRVWKVTTRTRPDRGELLYQAPLELTKKKNKNKEDKEDEDEWQTVLVPFEHFQLVRGPRMIPDGPPLNKTAGGLYQIGMTMSKFQLAATTTELENFRDGFFELHLKEIGLYKKNKHATAASAKTDQPSLAAVAPPKVLSRAETKKKRPLLLKVLLPIVRLFLFSEQSQRRKSAMRILRQQRKLSRFRAILWGWRSRANSIGMVRSTAKTLSILAMDSIRSVLQTVFRIVFLPFRLVRSVIGLVTGKKKPMAAE